MNADKDKAAGPTTFNRDYRITIISVVGFVGLVVALFFLARESSNNGPKNEKTGSVFHEIDFAPRSIAGKALSHLIDSLHKTIDSFVGEKEHYIAALRADRNDSVARDSVGKLSALIADDAGSEQTLLAYRNSFVDSAIIDTDALAKVRQWLHFRLSPDSLVAWNKRYDTMGTSWTAKVDYFARFNVNAKVFSYRDVANFKIKTYSSNIQFIARYPGAGIWIFLLAVFCAFCCISGPTAWFIHGEVLAIFKDDEKPKDPNKAYWITVGLVLVGLAVLFFALYWTFGDEAPVKPLFFMRTQMRAIVMANIIGAIAGAFCLAGFIYTTSMLGFFANKLTRKTDKILQKRDEARFAASPEQKQTAQDTLTCLVDDHHELQDQFRKLLGFFHRYFILSAVLLSLTVLCTGALYNAANSLEFVKLLVSRWGYSPAGGDTVYLYGGLYTLILLLVYLPAKMQFGDMRLALPHDKDDDDHDDADDNKWYGFLQQPFSLLKGGLIAATPFLSGIVQSLLDVVFRH